MSSRFHTILACHGQTDGLTELECAPQPLQQRPTAYEAMKPEHATLQGDEFAVCIITKFINLEGVKLEI